MSELRRHQPDKSFEEVNESSLRLCSRVERTMPPSLPAAKRKSSFKGVLTGVKGGDGDYDITPSAVSGDKQEVFVGLQVAEAAVLLHDDIYEAIGINGVLPVRYEGLLMTVGFRYTQEAEPGWRGWLHSPLYMRLYAMYDKDYRGDARFDQAHRLMMATFLKEIAPHDQNDNLDIEVAYGLSGIDYWTPDQEVLDLLGDS